MADLLRFPMVTDPREGGGGVCRGCGTTFAHRGCDGYCVWCFEHGGEDCALAHPDTDHEQWADG